MSKSSSPLELKWDNEKARAAVAPTADEVRALYEQADKDRREFCGAMATMASLYSEGRGNELLTAIKAVEAVSIHAMAIAECAIRAAFQQPDGEPPK